MQSASETKQNTFAEDVDKGLSANPKHLSSKYFYDDEGSRLFQEIMRLPEYYPTRAELGIFRSQTQQILEAFIAGRDDHASNTKSIDLIELGAGDGTKTAVLIEHFLKNDFDFTYSPIDISQEANDALSAKFREKFPSLRIDPH